MNKDLFECDRCRKTIEGSNKRTIRYVSGWFDSKHYVDLCLDCNKKLHKFIENK